MKRVNYVVVFLVMIFSCTQREQELELFRLLDNEEIGIDFINQLEYDRDFNVYKYRNYYNGGGVALGDVNNDGLADIYFTANLRGNRLYLNKGNNKFEDVTERAGVAGIRSWSTGVTMVDINADGFLDIYVCNSGDIQGDNKENELFINNGDLTFTEAASDYGLNDSGFSTHASFFDYDKDGDLDVYLLNNSYQAIGSFNLRIDERPNRDIKGGDKLLRNDNRVFTDVSEDAGIYGSVIGFGLGITVGDVNGDLWEDIYVSNDFFERDYLYINQRNGTFSEVLTEQMTSISGASMGADMADIDNYGHADIFVTEMLPSDPERLKSVTTFEDWNKYQYNVKNGYHHQFTRNTLQYNNGDGSFSEVGRFAGVEASDWSWGALFFDMNNDGLKDLFIANGIYQDLTNQDYLQYVANEQVIKSIINDDGVNYKELIDIIPSNPIPNHFYLNQGELRFSKTKGKAVDKPSFSNGAAYGDLDNDGDLDLVVNNVNMPPFIYENKTNLQSNSNYIGIELIGDNDNIDAIGSRISVKSDEGVNIEYQIQPARGFQSSVDFRSIIGIGEVVPNEIEVIWPDMRKQVIRDFNINEVLVIKKSSTDQVTNHMENSLEDDQIFTQANLISHTHSENNYNDFNRERLIYHMKSNLTPHMALGDLDGDGLEDLVVTGAKGSQTKLFFQNESGFSDAQIVGDLMNTDKEHSDVLLFDANGDGHLDIYLASGGVDVSPFSPYLFDELWMNDGRGNFTLSDQKLPNNSDNISTSSVIGEDFDDDGDIDLFVSERVKIGKYGAPCSGYILENNGQGFFTDVTEQKASFLIDLGMINDAKFVDLNGDGKKELILVGEFLPVIIAEWQDDKFVRRSVPSLSGSSGWYNVIHSTDLNNDDLPDLVIGNHGTNSRFRATKDQPIKLYFNDYDENGFPEGIITKTAEDGKDYPFTLRHNLVDQLKYLKKRFPDFESYQSADMELIFTSDERANVQILETNEMNTLLYINQGSYEFRSVDLPKEVQYTPIFAIESDDFDNDGDIDLILAGNQYNVLPEAGIYDASYGIYLQNDVNAVFTYLSPKQSGMKLKGQVRDMITSDNILIVARNNDEVLTFKY